MAEVREFTLGTLGGGAAEELFADALDKVLANIEDPNTDHKARREVILKLSFSAKEDRRVGDVAISIATKLAGVKGVTAQVYYGRHEGRRAIVEGPKQDELFTKPQGTPRPVEAVVAQGGAV